MAVTPNGVHASKERRGGIAGDGEERGGLTAFGELKLGALTNALVAVTEKGDEFSGSGFGETGGEQETRLETLGIFGGGGSFNAPDGAFAIERITADPIGHEERTIGMPGEADAHDAFA